MKKWVVLFGMLLASIGAAHAAADQCTVTTTTPNLGTGLQNLPCMPHGVAVVVTSGSVTATTEATATAANPSYVEGTANPLSQDLSGHLRVVLGAGSLVLGKVGIDQTTPGTTNGVQVVAALPAGANVIGHVITDTGSTTAVTGNVTVIQGTGTNLHTVIDSGTTAVTNAGTFVVQENGAALTSLQLLDNAIAPITPATATATNSLLLGSEYRSTLPTWTNTQQGALQVGTRGSLDVTLFTQDTNVAAGYQANNADGIASSSTVNKLVVNSQSYILNGSGSFDRQVSVSNGMNIAATGIGAAGLAGQCDDTSPTSLTENSWGAVRESCTTHAVYTERLPSSSAAVAMAPVNSGSLETGHVILASAGNLYNCDWTTTTVAGYALVFNSTTVPAAGAVTPVASYYIGAFGSFSKNWDPPLRLGTGISVAFSSATTPFTKTDSATAFISCQGQ